MEELAQIILLEQNSTSECQPVQASGAPPIQVLRRSCASRMTVRSGDCRRIIMQDPSLRARLKRIFAQFRGKVAMKKNIQRDLPCTSRKCPRCSFVANTLPGLRLFILFRSSSFVVSAFTFEYRHRHGFLLPSWHLYYNISHLFISL